MLRMLRKFFMRLFTIPVQRYYHFQAKRISHKEQDKMTIIKSDHKEEENGTWEQI